MNEMRGAADLNALADEGIAGLADELSKPGLPLGLFNGLTGAGWVLNEYADSEARVLSQIDLSLIRHITAAGGQTHFDLPTGLAGILLYFLSREHQEGIELVVDWLEQRSCVSHDGRHWRTAPEHLPEWQREVAPSGWVDLGLAHGQVGVIGVLARVVHAGRDPSNKARAMLTEAVHYVRSQANPTVGGLYAKLSAPFHSECRLGWCYGAPGVASAFTYAAAALADQALANHATQLALETAELTNHSAPELDTICHGLSGIGHIVSKFAHRLGDSHLHSIAARHMKELADRPWTFEEHFNTADGLSGIILAMQSAVTGISDWDRYLLIDLPSWSILEDHEAGGF